MRKLVIIKINDDLSEEELYFKIAELVKEFNPSFIEVSGKNKTINNGERGYAN
jgi:hypothetical protein